MAAGCPDKMECQTFLKLQRAVQKPSKHIVKSIFSELSSQQKPQRARNHLLSHRFTSIKHTFSRSEELAKKSREWETIQRPHNGSHNKPQISSNPVTHVFDHEKTCTPLRRNACKFSRSKTRCLTKRNNCVAQIFENAFRRPWQTEADKGRHGFVRHGMATSETAKPT